MVVWLIDQHLLMSMVAQTRDLHDRKTITDFAEKVQSLDRLKMLLVLTICDIRAVGPGVWNGWKGQLLRTLYYETELLLSGGFSQVSRKERAKHAAEQLSKALEGWSQKDQRTYTKLHYEPYLLSVDLEDQVRHAHFIRESTRRARRSPHGAHPPVPRDHRNHGALTRPSAPPFDHRRRLCGGRCQHRRRADIHDLGRPRTRHDLINREFPIDEDEMRRAATIGKMIEDVLSGRKRLPEVIATRSKGKKRTRTFPVQPDVRISNALSNKFTVIEVECLDRIGLLAEITAVLSDLSLDIHSARITTFGEKVIDTFYVTDLVGQKVTNEKPPGQHRQSPEAGDDRTARRVEGQHALGRNHRATAARYPTAPRKARA